jgi:hypothetical protein
VVVDLNKKLWEVPVMTGPLGWSVLEQTLVRRERWPGGKLKCVPLVYPGQDVLPDQPVLRIEQQEKVAESVLAGQRLSLPAGNKIDIKAVRDGLNAVGEGETIPAGLRGRVVDITRRGGVLIESRAAVVQGALGAGNQVAGILTMWQPNNAFQGPQAIPPGAILVMPGPLNLTMLRLAINSGIAGMIASSIETRDLEGFLQTDLIQLLDSDNVEQTQAHLPSLTLLLTEGLGSMAMPARIMNLLSQHQGSVVLLSGVTSLRQYIQPELIISLSAKETQQNWQPVKPDMALLMGAHVRVCSGEHKGAIGTIDHLFAYQQVFSSGVHAHAARLRLEDGSQLVLPLTLIERIG